MIPTWYLLSIATGMYVGPMYAQECADVEKFTRAHSIVCKQAVVMRACPVPDHPGYVTSCPVFDVPQVTVKP